MEVCSLRDAANAFYSSEIRVFGISLDSVALQKQFHEREELNFPLLSDPDGSVAGKFGALVKGRPFANRLTYVIDKEGVLRAIDDKVDVSKHGQDLVELIEGLEAE